MFQTIAFQPGQTSRNFTVDILPDELPEPSEFFNAISNTSQLRVSLTAPSSPLVEITDDDSECNIADLSGGHFGCAFSSDTVLVLDVLVLRGWGVGEQYLSLYLVAKVAASL